MKMVRLISYSLVSIVPPPFKTEYIAGIVEDGKGKRTPTRIERSYFDILKIGISGTIEKKETDYGELTYFIPETTESKKRKVALVTGASRGIGRAIAIELAGKGYDVAINDVEQSDEGKETMRHIESLGRRSLFVNADVSNFSNVQQMTDKVLGEFGRIDVLVNNAGINVDKLVTNMSPQDWQRVIDVNLTGVFNCTKTVLRT